MSASTVAHNVVEKKPQESVALATNQPTPMDLLQIALSNNAAIDVIERLAALQEKSLARMAEQEFNTAMTAAQAELGRVAPDLTNPQTHSQYASYAAIDRRIRPIYTKHGFSLSFDSGDIDKPDTVLVRCYVSHRAGHTRTYHAPPMPADGKGAKGSDVMTKTHATGSAMSYGMRYLLKYIFNVAIGQEDDDGNGASNGSHITDERAVECLDWITNASSVDELKKVYQAAYKEADALHDAATCKAYVEAKNKRYKELANANR